MYDPWQGPETLNSPPGRFSVQQRCLLAQKSKPKSKPRLTGTEWQVSFYSVRSVDLETENRTWERAGIPTSNSSVWNTRPQTWLSHWKHCLIYQGPKSLLCSPNVLKIRQLGITMVARGRTDTSAGKNTVGRTASSLSSHWEQPTEENWPITTFA